MIAFNVGCQACQEWADMLTIGLLDSVVYKFKLITLTLASILGRIIDLYKLTILACDLITITAHLIR